MKKAPSTSSEKSWWEQDIANKQKIVKALWERISTETPFELKDHVGTIGFLASASEGEKTTEDIEKLFIQTNNQAITIEQFSKAFDFLSPLEAKLLPLNKVVAEELSTWQSPTKGAIKVSEHAEEKLSQYCKEGNISAAVSLGNAKDKSLNLHADEVFATHSVTKIFTGILLIKMLQERIMDESLLDMPIQNCISESAWQKLPLELQEHLSKGKGMTLKQMMVHTSGLGDYGYDSGTGKMRDLYNSVNPPVLDRIEDFLPLAEVRTYEINDKHLDHYSNLGLTLVGLAIEHAYNHKIKEAEHLTFDDLLKKYILDPANVKYFQSRAPEGEKIVRINPNDKAGKDWVGGPAGGYWSTCQDLSKFCHWLLKSFKNSEFQELLAKYGTEFYKDKSKTIEHPGQSEFTSAFLSINLANGNYVSVLSDQASPGLPLGLELMMSGRIFKEAPKLKKTRQAKTEQKPGNQELLFLKEERTTEIQPKIKKGGQKDDCQKNDLRTKSSPKPGKR